MKLLLRGHIRNSFDNDNLYNLLRALDTRYNLELYIQMWNICSSSASWRPVSQNNTAVTGHTVKAYFRELVPKIKTLIISDEKDTTLYGSLVGNVSRSGMPMKGWKYMIYSMFQITESLYNNSTDRSEKVVITRFDVMENSNSFSKEHIIEYVSRNIDTLQPIVFARESKTAHWGCENLMIGDIGSLYRLLYNMYKHTDEVLARHTPCAHQEYFFMYEQAFLEGSPPVP